MKKPKINVWQLVKFILKYAGILIIVGETIEYGYKKFTAKYGEPVEPKSNSIEQ